MKTTNLVSVWIGKVAQVHVTHITFTNTRRRFYAGTAARYRDIMQRLYLLGRVTGEADG